MGKLPQLNAIEFSKILKKIGFQFIRQRGSHMFFKHADGRTTVVPNHPSEEIDRGLLNKIIRKDLQMTREEFMKLI
jgi:predicted RNA binding protein YcfA (HicA-like mRNA interferase family)